MNKKVIILVAAHKPYRMPTDGMYLPIQVGAAGKESIGFQRDDEGENISALNPSFCELTAVYWAWKNLDADYIGLAHYRRHFALRSGNDLWNQVLRGDELEPDLGRIRVFVPNKRRYFIETLYSHYAHTHEARHLDETRKIIEKKHPDMIPACDRVFQQRWGYMFNMMILEHSLFNDYCSWLFEILFELQNRIGTADLTPFNARYVGRISEILWNVWLTWMIETGELTHEEIREIPVIHMEETNWWRKGTRFLKAKFLNQKYE